MATPDMDVIKEIPGYKVILKAVLKSQIQQLVEQLAAHTDEESVILTASVSDGTLSHLGSDSGKNFLDDHEDIKSQFLGFCLKRHHKKKAQQQQEQQAQQMRTPPWPTHLGPGPGSGPRPRLSTPRQSFPRHSVPRHPMSVPSSLGKSVRHEPYPTSKPRRSMDSNFDLGKSSPFSESGANSSIKMEPDDSSQHSRNDGESSPSDRNIPNEDGQSYDSTTPGGASDSNTSDPMNSEMDPNLNVKVEANTEGDTELEITGVELGSDPMGSQKDLLQTNVPLVYDPSGPAPSPSDMQAGYNPISHIPAKASKFVCDLCGKGFNAKLHLEDHKNMHTGRRPYKCEVCNRGFTQKVHMRSHMITHFKNKNMP